MACNPVCTEKSRMKKKIIYDFCQEDEIMCFTLMIFERSHQKSYLWGFPPSCGDVQSQSISLVSRIGQNIIYHDFSSIYKRIVYSKRLEMLDLLKKKGNCTIFAAKIKAWNS